MKRYLLIIGTTSLIVILFLLVQPSSDTPVTGEINFREEALPVDRSERILPVKESKAITISEVPDESVHVDPDRDYLLWRKVSDDVEAEWNEELFSHIQYVDRERAQNLYRKYLEERRNFLRPQEVTLTDSLNELSRLNGESIEERDKGPDPMADNDFAMKLRKLFGPHYRYIEDQRKIFLDTHEA